MSYNGKKYAEYYEECDSSGFSEPEKDKDKILDNILETLKKFLEWFFRCITCGCCYGNTAKPNFMGTVSDNEPSEMEKEALANLLYYLETEEELTIEFQQLMALRILIYSDNLELQQSAALCYLEISERMQDCPTTVILCPLIDLLRRKNDQVCRAATQALSNFLLRMPYCKSEMYPCQPIQPLIALLHSTNSDILCNTCACLTSLATSDPCRVEILAEDGLHLLLKMLPNSDLRVLRNAVGAIFNLTQMAESRDEIVREGGIPLLITVLRDCYDIDVRYYCFGAIGNIAITPENRQALLEADEKLLVNYLLVLNLSSESEKIVCQCLVALRNLASDAANQEELAVGGAVGKIHEIIKSTENKEILTMALGCLRNLSAHDGNQIMFISEEFLEDLGDILSDNSNPEAQRHSAAVIRNLVDGDFIQIIKRRSLEMLVSVTMKTDCSSEVLGEVTGAISILAAEDDIKFCLLQLEEGKVFQQLVIMASQNPNPEVQYNCAGTICQILINETLTDYQKEENLHNIIVYLDTFLKSTDPNFVHLSLWTIRNLVTDDTFSDAFKDHGIDTVIHEVMATGVDLETGTISKLARRILKHLATDDIQSSTP